MTEMSTEEAEKEGIFKGTGKYWTPEIGETIIFVVYSKGFNVVKVGELDLAGNKAQYAKTEMLVRDHKKKVRSLKVHADLGRKILEQLKTNKVPLQGSKWTGTRKGKQSYEAGYASATRISDHDVEMALKELKEGSTLDKLKGMIDQLPPEMRDKIKDLV